MGSLLPGDKFLTVITEAQRVTHPLDGIFILVILAQKSLHFFLVTRRYVLQRDVKNTIKVKEFSSSGVNVWSLLTETRIWGRLDNMTGCLGCVLK